jgi:nucleotide-binding universal stress UspA family protein
VTVGVRHGEVQRSAPGGHAPRPDLLAKLATRVDPAAERMAIETALEMGARLIVANIVRLPPFHVSLRLHGPSGTVLPHEDDREEVRGTAQRAAARGLTVELLRVFTSHPPRALTELAGERAAALVVIGPDAGRISRRVVRRAARALRSADCLVWIAPDGYC